MKQVYLDSAATTSVRPEVVEEMIKVLRDDYGNPSSTYSIGRHAKALIESARKIIAKQFNVSSSEIIFNSCGTEGNNWILRSAVRDLGVKRIISTKLEHHAVLNTIKQLNAEYGVEMVFLDIKETSEIDYEQLEQFLKDGDKQTLVSIIHVNNDVGNEIE